MAQVSAPNGAGPWTQWRRSVHPMAQVRFYPTDLRRKSASHTLLMAQVPPLKTDLLHSSHPPAPFTLLACTIHSTHLRHSPYPPAPLYPTHLHQRPHCPARRHHQAQNSAAAHNQVRRLLSHGTAPSQNTARGAGKPFLPETGLEHGPLLPKCRLLTYRGRSPSASPACLIPRADVVLQENAANVLLAEL